LTTFEQVQRGDVGRLGERRVGLRAEPAVRVHDPDRAEQVGPGAHGNGQPGHAPGACREPVHLRGPAELRLGDELGI
jgi:hypothetical protein